MNKEISEISEDTKTILSQLLQIYQLLVNQPDPEEEEEAQHNLLKLLTDFPLDQAELWNKVQELKQIVEQWDTLDQWYTEVEKLDILFKKMLAPFFPEIFKEISQESEQNDPETLAKTDSTPKTISSQPMQDRIQSRLQAMEEKMSAFVQKEHPLKITNPMPVPKFKSPPTHSELTKHHVQFTTKKTKLQAPKIIIPNLTPKNPLVTRQSVPAILSETGVSNVTVTSHIERPPIDPDKNTPIPTPAPAPSNSTPNIIPSAFVINPKPSTPSPSAFRPKITQIQSSSRIVRPEETPNFNVKQVSAPILKDVKSSNDAIVAKNSITLETHGDQHLAQSLSDSNQRKYQNLAQLEAKKVYYTNRIQVLQSELENKSISTEKFQEQLSEVNSLLLHCSTDINSLQQKLKKQI